MECQHEWIKVFENESVLYQGCVKCKKVEKINLLPIKDFIDDDKRKELNRNMKYEIRLL
jgi:hypothetical protein